MISEKRKKMLFCRFGDVESLRTVASAAKLELNHNALR